MPRRRIVVFVGGCIPASPLVSFVNKLGVVVHPVRELHSRGRHSSIAVLFVLRFWLPVHNAEERAVATIHPRSKNVAHQNNQSPFTVSTQFPRKVSQASWPFSTNNTKLPGMDEAHKLRRLIVLFPQLFLVKRNIALTSTFRGIRKTLSRIQQTLAHENQCVCNLSP